MKTITPIILTALLFFTTGAAFNSMRSRSQINLEIARLNKVATQGRNPSNMVARCQISTLQWTLNYPYSPSSNTMTWTRHITLSILGNPRD